MEGWGFLRCLGLVCFASSSLCCSNARPPASRGETEHPIFSPPSLFERLSQCILNSLFCICSESIINSSSPPCLQLWNQRFLGPMLLCCYSRARCSDAIR
ncbi:hypothetical protein B0H17DRAFT_331554 [Mycena rosella]|uniref:Secreted protein n=1 Tax=Mycena rosella TaxID=1033263 RepID=A0AAD7CRX4_MYCRO|nr:hypothetical protein B0H17DRAFT_331554 [Mycena rosella]